jgi:signal peptidase
MTGSGDDTDDEQSSPADGEDPLEEVLGEETLTGPDAEDSTVPTIEPDQSEEDTEGTDDPFVGPGEDRRNSSDETPTETTAPENAEESSEEPNPQSRNVETSNKNSDTQQPDPSTVPKGSPREQLLTEDGVGGLYEPPEESTQPDQTPSDRLKKQEPTEDTSQTPLDKLKQRASGDNTTQTATEQDSSTPGTQDRKTEAGTQDQAVEAGAQDQAVEAGTRGESSHASGDQHSQARRPVQSNQNTDPPPQVGSEGQPRPARERETADWQLFVKDIVTSVIAVALLGGYLFAISGIWPPMVAIESESMTPHMNVDDLVFLVDNDRFAPSEAQAGTGVVTAQTGAETGYSNYGGSGDVIVFAPDGNKQTTPIIHRAMFWVEEGENWCDQANPEYLGGLSPDNEECIAENSGFITKGDNNNRYDQAAAQADYPVKSEWVVGTAEARLPRLGWFRLQFQ